MLSPYLVLLSSLLDRDRFVVTVVLGLGTYPAEDLPIFLTEQVQSLSMYLTPFPLCDFIGILANLFKVVHHVSQWPIGPEVSEQEGVLTHRTDAATIFPDLRDAFVAEAVATVNAHRLHYRIQADRACDLLPHHCQGHCCSHRGDVLSKQHCGDPGGSLVGRGEREMSRREGLCEKKNNPKENTRNSEVEGVKTTPEH